MIDNFESNFPIMYQFLGAWFSDLDYEDITYQEVVKNYKKVAKSEKIDSLKLEFKEILIKKLLIINIYLNYQIFILKIMKMFWNGLVKYIII